MEASIVDIPANSNAVRLYDRSTSVLLAAGMDTNSVPALSTTSFKNKMTLKESWSAFLSFLNISQDKAVTTELSAENLDSLHNEFQILSMIHWPGLNRRTVLSYKLNRRSIRNYLMRLLK